MATGSAQVNFGPMHLKRIEMPLPSDSAVRAFNKKAKPLIKYMIAMHAQNEKLARCRDTLLPKLMSGEIDVSQVDITQLNNHLCVPVIVICAYLAILVRAIILCRSKEGVAMSVPKYDDMMLPVLICLSGKPEGEMATPKELRDFAADYWRLTEEQKAETIPSGFARYMKNVQWA